MKGSSRCWPNVVSSASHIKLPWSSRRWLAPPRQPLLPLLTTAYDSADKGCPLRRAVRSRQPWLTWRRGWLNEPFDSVSAELLNPTDSSRVGVVLYRAGSPGGSIRERPNPHKGATGILQS